MSEHDPVWQSGEDVQLVENVLRDTSVTPNTRKALLQRASMSLLAAGGLGAVIAGCGSNSKSTSATAATTSKTTTTPASGASADIQKLINVAATAEALAVTYLTAVVKGSGGTPVAKFADVLKAANAEEYDHYKALTGLGAKPLTTKFWAPKAFFGHNLDGVFPTLEVAETLFVNAYLIGMTTFAKAGKSQLARYAGEICGVEAEHLALARFAAGKLPNDLGFADYSITSIDGIVAALEKAGVGFGTKGSAPGMFVNFAPPPSDAVTMVTNSTPA